MLKFPPAKTFSYPGYIKSCHCLNAKLNKATSADKHVYQGLS